MFLILAVLGIKIAIMSYSSKDDKGLENILVIIIVHICNIESITNSNG